MNELAKTNPQAEKVDAIMMMQDYSKATVEERVMVIQRLCESLGINPITGPFQWMTLNGRLIPYATRNCAEQLRAVNKLSLSIVAREVIGDVYVVTARCRRPDGREDESTGAVGIAGLKGDPLANAYMKAETKAKRRVTLSACGLGFSDETEVETIPGARVVSVESRPAATMTRKGDADLDGLLLGEKVDRGTGEVVVDYNVKAAMALMARGITETAAKDIVSKGLAKRKSKSMTEAMFKEFAALVEAGEFDKFRPVREPEGNETFTDAEVDAAMAKAED